MYHINITPLHGVELCKNHVHNSMFTLEWGICPYFCQLIW